MKLIITDSNILFDVVNIGALPEFFSLDFEICTTAFVIEEIKSVEQRKMVNVFIRSKKLRVFDFTSEEVTKIEEWNAGKKLKRFTDSSVIWIAHQLKCTVLTGDSRMREVAEELGIVVHGIIWVIDELFRYEQISEKETRILFERLLTSNNWLPREEIEKRIRKLK